MALSSVLSSLQQYVGQPVAGAYARVPSYAQAAIKLVAFASVPVITYLANHKIGGLPVFVPYTRVTTPATIAQRPVLVDLREDMYNSQSPVVRTDASNPDSSVVQVAKGYAYWTLDAQGNPDQLLMKDNNGDSRAVMTPLTQEVVTVPASASWNKQLMWVSYGKDVAWTTKALAALKSVGLVAVAATVGYFTAKKL